MPIALLLVGALLRAILLLPPSLWSDEALTLVVSRSGDLLDLLRRLESSPPLYFLLMRVWVPLFSDPLVAIRLFSFLCGTASLWVFYRFCRRALPEAAETALFIACLSSYWIHMAQDGRFYSLYLLIALGQTALAYRLIEGESRSLWAGYIVLGALGLYTHYYFLFLVLAQAGLITLVRASQRRSPLPPLAACAAIAILYAPWLPSLIAQARAWEGATLVVERFDAARIGLIFGHMVADLSYVALVGGVWVSWLGGLVLGLLAFGAALYLRGGRGAGGVGARLAEGEAFCLMNIVLGLAAFPVVSLFVTIPLIQPRYFVFLSPCVYLFMGWICTRPTRWAGRLRISLEILMAAGLLGYYASRHIVDLRLPALARAIRAQAGDRRPIVHVHPYYFLPLRYYYLPERTHLLVPAHPKDLHDGRALPGARALITRRELLSIGPCWVIDPERRFGARSLAVSTGAELSARLEGGPWY